ncbi:hypothetical protein FQN60_016035 [Etheostoma spectabile]|uniref:Helix-turn-helix domain-containing protein n=1 Tax=Etheostoma spectabile TaxID=54343 RepID=A0A5J5CG86_9PERO|nr:hypothetical protein FQN60_016035 [Etheostoma spectabile]
MDRKYSPSYADIYLAHWEETAFHKLRIKPLLYFRYLDDTFGLWYNTKQTFLTFLDTLNSHPSKVKLKHTLQPVTVEFLNKRVFIRSSCNQSKTLATKMYFKDTDRHALLHKTSYNPMHTYRGLIKSQLIRFHRICTFPEHFSYSRPTYADAVRGNERSNSHHDIEAKTRLNI